MMGLDTKIIVIYETKLAKIGLAKTARATLGSPILFFENIKKFFSVFISAGIRSHIFVTIRLAAKLYSFNICSMKMFTTSKFIARIFAKLKTWFIIIGDVLNHTLKKIFNRGVNRFN